MENMLPIGLKVFVTPAIPVRGPAYRARIVGYNADRTKYHLGAEIRPNVYAKGGSWGTAAEVTISGGKG